MIQTFSASDLEQLHKDWVLASQLKLPKNPTIVIAGAYQGKLIRLMAEMYPHHAGIYGYEPQKWAYDKCVQNTAHLRKVHIFNHGLLADSGVVTMPMGEWGTDACSIFTTDRGQGEGIFEDAYIALRGIDIDLFIMNMEGYEYVLLPYFIDKKIVNWIDQVTVQFHTKYDTPDIMDTFSTLSKIYHCEVNQYPKWVYWIRRS